MTINRVIFSTPYPRPKHLSDPFRHFSSSELKNLIGKQDDRLVFGDFRTLFHWETPAGTYEEVAYFLPLALEYMRQMPDESREFSSGVICFASGNSVKLDKDKLLTHILESLRLCFETWTSKFNVVHFDRHACREKGWQLEHFDYVCNSEAVMELLGDLRSYAICKGLASELVQSLKTTPNRATNSAWLLEYATQADEHPFEHELLQKHYSSIASTLVKEVASPTYWASIRKELNLSPIAY